MISGTDITVLITIKNGERTIDRCLQSVYDQTYKPISVICVNDASSDQTQEKLISWKKRFGENFFSIINNDTNLGVTRSSNVGLRAIKTELVARIDADDWWEETKLEKQISFLRKNPEYNIVGCNYINHYKSSSQHVSKAENDDILRAEIIKRNPFAHSCVVFRLETAKRAGLYDESIRYAGDYELYLRLWPYSKFHNIQEFLCHRDIQDGGISLKKRRQQMLQGIKTKIKYIRKYDLPIGNYIYLGELILVAFTPAFIRNLKRLLTR